MKIILGRRAALAAALLSVPAMAAEQIKVVERPVGETTVDLGAKGDSIGDLLVFANGIFDAANKAQIGSDQGYCVHHCRQELGMQLDHDFEGWPDHRRGTVHG